MDEPVEDMAMRIAEMLTSVPAAMGVYRRTYSVLDVPPVPMEIPGVVAPVVLISTV